MRRFPTLFGLTLLGLLFASAYARAEQVSWNYGTTPSVAAITSGASQITLSTENKAGVVGNSDIVMTNLQTVSTADPNHADTFTHASYSIKLTITDLSSTLSDNLTFSGEFNGTVSSQSANVGNTPLGQQTQSIKIGSHTYTVTVNTYVPPPPPGSSNKGSIGASAEVSVSPEPSTVVMGAFGLSFVGLVFWGKRRGKALVAVV